MTRRRVPSVVGLPVVDVALVPAPASLGPIVDVEIIPVSEVLRLGLLKAFGERLCAIEPPEDP